MAIYGDITVYVARPLIVWALVNLLSNAHKYGGHEDEVRVQAGRLETALVEVVVSDAGEGVPPEFEPPEFVPHLFERFSRPASGVAPAPTGTGLGLYVVRELVEANGGRSGTNRTGRPEAAS